MVKKLRKPWNIHETFDVKQASLDNFQDKMGFPALEGSKVLVKSNCPTDLLSRQKKKRRYIKRKSAEPVAHIHYIIVFLSNLLNCLKKLCTILLDSWLEF